MKFELPFKLKLIYVFRINDAEHKNCLKIGEATSDNENIWGLEPNCKALNDAAKKRINQYTQTAGIHFELLYTEVAVFSKKGKIHAFSDDEVHKVLLRSGIKRKTFDTENKANEWFETDLETVKKAIKAVKDGKESLTAAEITVGQNPIEFRPEQQIAINETIKQFRKSNQMLWNAKMRFGKTLSALQVVKVKNFTRTLILTHRPVVDAGWFEDFKKIFTEKDTNFRYGSKDNGDTFTTLESQCKNENCHYIYFASMQDLRGSEKVGGNFLKNKELFTAEWDFVIVDEAHEGTKTELGINVMSELVKPDTKVLRLSGTPFNLLDDFKEDEIYTWDYVMEQRAKADWDKIHFGDPNPYSALPRLNIYTYDLGKLLTKYIDEELAFNFREFFRTNADGKFRYENDVRSFLNLICKTDNESNYPFATQAHRDNFRHSLWMVPGVKEARALSGILQSHPVFSQFQIVNVAGDGDKDEEKANQEALKKVENAIGKNPHETYTITLSCGRLTTGVSVPAWTAVFMLSGSFNSSASAYMQTIFRVQTPANINGRVKEECFVFDFAPDRTLKVIAETAKISSKAGKTTKEDREIMGEFLNFCPIIAVDGSRMKTYNVEGMLAQLKKVYIDRVVSNGFEDKFLYNNDQLMKLDALALNEFEGLKKIIGSTKSMPKSGDIDINRQGFTDEKYEQLETAEKLKRSNQELTEEQKRLLDEKAEKKKNRDSAISILQGISIRMPLLIYGAEANKEEAEITIDNFAELIDPQSWTEFMPKGVSKDVFYSFKKYYEPDIFREAGKRIRTMARAADQLSVEERIARLTTIFGSFRNPDKETVLTPWRVVNMHLGDCLGGYVFYDEKMENTLLEPRFVDHGQVTHEVFATDARILEINSKSGLYPLYMVYGIYRSHLAATESSPTIEEQYALWDRVVAENIFVICKTPMAKSITRRTLVGFRKAKVNTRYFEDLVNQITNKPDQFIDKIKRGKTFNNTKIDIMNFNAIVGNPPYQENISSSSDNASLSKQLFPTFIEISIKINSKYLTLITPSRWFTGDAQDKSFLKLRQFVRENNHIEKIINYPISRNVFNGVEISGGVNYFLFNPNYKGDVEFIEYNLTDSNISAHRPLFEDGMDVILSNGRNYKLIQKVKNENFISMTTITQGRNAFGIVGKNINDISSEIYKEDFYELRCKYEEIRFIDEKYISKNKKIADKWKIFISKGNGGAGLLTDNKEVAILGKPFIGKPKSVCTDSLIPIGCFETAYEANSLLLYIKTKFFRYMVGLLKVSQNVYQNVYQFVPLQDFTPASDIDWNKSISEIDMQLYQKYNLNAEEIAFIEAMIKPMA